MPVFFAALLRDACPGPGQRLGAGRAHAALPLRSRSGQIPDFDGEHLIGRASGDSVPVQDDVAFPACGHHVVIADDAHVVVVWCAIGEYWQHIARLGGVAVRITTTG